MPEFDLHEAIKRLAEAEGNCPVCHGQMGFISTSESIGGTLPGWVSCRDCNGTGCIVPFASLRVQRQAWNTTWRGEIEWIPEPDVEKACWRTIESHPEILVVLMDRGVDYEIKEAVLRAAETWVKEQYDI